MLILKICDRDGNEKAIVSGKNINFVYNSCYNEGDRIEITLKDCSFISVQFDKTMKEGIIYAPKGTVNYEIPYGSYFEIYHPDAFKGDENSIMVREASEEEIHALRNIALNPADKRYQTEYFPHAHANYVTRDEVHFEERNSIDGVIETDGHGLYPFQSYAGGAREDIEYYLEFGLPVEIEKIVFYLRADFAKGEYTEDHDTYWKSLSVEFSDGTKIPASFVKSGEAQELVLENKKVTEMIHLTDFKQAANPLSWAALSQIEVYGKILK